MKKEATSAYAAGIGRTIGIQVQDYVNEFFAQLETFKDRKQPNMGNAGKSIAYVKKGKDGNLSSIKVGLKRLRAGNAVIDSLKSIKFNNVQAKLPTWAKTSLIEGGGKQGCNHNSSINGSGQYFIVGISKKNGSKFVRSAGRIAKISLFNAF